MMTFQLKIELFCVFATVGLGGDIFDARVSLASKRTHRDVRGVLYCAVDVCHCIRAYFFRP